MLKKSNSVLSILFLSVLILFGACKKESPEKSPTPEPTTPYPTAIGKPIGDPVSKQIGASGGSITSPDGRITLEIPSGALSNNTTITIQPIENTTPLGIGLSYDFSPNGQQFAKPVTVTLHYTDEEIAGTTPELLEFGFQNDRNEWQGTNKIQVNKSSHTVSTSIKHFSRWSFYATYKMEPNSRPLLVNQTALLTVVKLGYTEDPDPNNPTELLHTLKQTQLVPNDKVSNWKVNGQPGNQGNGNGSLSGSDNNQKTYKAPASIPANNPVMISADINTGKGTITVISNITVIKESYFEFSCDGQSYKDLEGNVTGATSAGTLYIFMMAKNPSGDKLPSLVLTMGEGFKGVGTYAFGEKNLVATSTTAYPYEWKTEYYEQNRAMPRFGEGSVTINTWGKIGELVAGTISGTLHYQKTVLNSTIHLTAPLNAKFSYIRNE